MSVFNKVQFPCLSPYLLKLEVSFVESSHWAIDEAWQIDYLISIWYSNVYRDSMLVGIFHIQIFPAAATIHTPKDMWIIEWKNLGSQPTRASEISHYFYMNHQSNAKGED